MSMLTLNGIVQNVFSKQAGVDKKTGEVIPPSDHVQVMAENTLPNGEKRMELVTLKVEHLDAYRKLLGRLRRGGLLTGELLRRLRSRLVLFRERDLRFFKVDLCSRNFPESGLQVCDVPLSAGGLLVHF